ncbi:MAG: hypothetical protein DDT20_00364 [Firmicutes bacterium]|uniref:4Fe-4S Mo/W bis-MGD-type domain-containing protein n=1 Tax=Candidatus Hakubella thermalkaliphila TaxID=2754717 RepID=A0A6V8P111_9ACTN|nr:DUF1667 domain-containing protein [Candidatus Hakubella thermalkaliphila]MBT9176062.1 hypothetical protein [Bacillota bacterium]GFP25440.1 hypothetical protein HKBW3S25_00912 [Candidatus Hakubella thermalkaliphila]GFP26723.1 hypothetical protein HKBW3S33_00138 [Candidatus Hakubella thermalkaliphila]GFP40984.1 hypothetical protein HKBW3C_00109 [Candidatus Hakubella thermalkaliphila]
MVKETTKLICITCPVGCRLEVTHEGKTIVKVEGDECKKGIDYAETELSDPQRMVFTVVRVKDGLHPVVPVRSTEPVPKAKIFPILRRLREVELEAPVEMHQVVLANAEGTGIGVVTSRPLPAMAEQPTSAPVGES